jgi:hypothetical protein
MRLLIYLDLHGVERIELTHAGESEREREQVHSLYILLQPEIARLDAAVKAAEAREHEHGKQ